MTIKKASPQGLLTGDAPNTIRRTADLTLYHGSLDSPWTVWYSIDPGQFQGSANLNVGEVRIIDIDCIREGNIRRYIRRPMGTYFSTTIETSDGGLADLSEEVTPMTARMRETTRAIERFQRGLFAGLTPRKQTEFVVSMRTTNDDTWAKVRAEATPTPREAFWSRIKKTLQAWHGLSIEDLAAIMGVSKATLLYINHPDRSPRPSTATKVLNFYGLSLELVNAISADSAIAWFATEGRRALAGGVLAFERAIRLRLARSVRHYEGGSFSALRDENQDFEEAAVPDGPRARKARRR